MLGGGGGNRTLDLVDQLFTARQQPIRQSTHEERIAPDVYRRWTRGGHSGSHFYVRQLWDMKGSADIESFASKKLRRYATVCGWTLAHAHCRAGSASALSGYLGEDDKFDRAIANYAVAYADLAEADYAQFKATCAAAV